VAVRQTAWIEIVSDMYFDAANLASAIEVPRSDWWSKGDRIERRGEEGEVRHNSRWGYQSSTVDTFDSATVLSQLQDELLPAVDRIARAARDHSLQPVVGLDVVMDVEHSTHRDTYIVAPTISLPRLFIQMLESLSARFVVNLISDAIYPDADD
jgi:Domain of unknown function (DUF4279)